jgi:hypothetical protein
LTKELTMPRKRGRPYAGGGDPLLNARAPTSLIEAIRANAVSRKVAMSVVIRDALERYLSDNADGAPRSRDAREAA